jgi:tripartite-type tricarboxylate transporter receptor subunit TctC
MPRIRLLAALAAFLLIGPACAVDPSWPTRPVTLIAPFPPGGTVDIIARTIGQKLGEELGKPFVVENKSGAGGSIGVAAMVHAGGDGYTFAVDHMGLAFNAALYDKLPYDTMRDVVPVAYVGATPNVLVASKSFPVKSVADFLALAKAKPTTINYGSGGIGSAGHLPMELLQSATGIKLVHVPYKGNGPAIVGLISGQIQVMLATIPAMKPYITSGQLHAIATSGSHRSAALPDLPTLDEAGVKGFQYQPWYGVFAPAGTPPEILDGMHDAIVRVLADPEIAKRLGQQGLEVKVMSRQEFADIVHADVVKWGEIIKSLGIKGK